MTEKLPSRKGPKEKRTLAGTKAIRESIDLKYEAKRPEVMAVTRMTPEAAQNALEWCRSGGTVAQWAVKAGVTKQAVNHYLHVHHREELAEARKAGADALAEEAMEIASNPLMLEETLETEDGSGRVTKTVKRADAVQARKLAVWTRLELLKVWDPERYGNKIQVDASGSMLEALAAARKRIAPAEAPEET